MRVLGIDPGLATVGYGLVDKNGNIFKAVDYGHISTTADTKLPQRLMIIFQSIQQLIMRFSPDVLAMEKLFFSKNSATAMKVGEARGAIIMAAAEKELPVSEYTPLQVKQAVAGYGRAGKKQVQEMICLLLKLAEQPKPDDAADALAVALCHLQSARWQQIVENNYRT